MQRSTIPIVCVAVLGLSLCASDVPASDSHAVDAYNVGSGALAIEGYDPVAYFAGAPAKGSSAYAAGHGGIEYRFASAANREKFVKDPHRFAPAYGGWCAYAMAEGKKVGVDPIHYKIVGGRLMLFYRTFFGDALKKWNEGDEKSLTKDADAKWTNLSGEGGR